MLASELEVEVVGVEQDDRSALDRIRSSRPDVVLVDSSVRPEDRSPTIAEIFDKVPGARVITMSVQENGIDIYDRQRVVASGPEDLLRIIRRGGESVPNGDSPIESPRSS